MLGNQMDFSSCVIWIGFHKSSHILQIVQGGKVHGFCGSIGTAKLFQ